MSSAMLPNYEQASNTNIENSMTSLQSLGKPQEDFLFATINDWLNSDKRKLMITAQEYYENDNAIIERERYYIDRKGVQQKVTNLSNSKLPHPFMRKLTNQKVNYLLSKELTIQCEDQSFSDTLGNYVNKKFLKMIKNVGRDAIINGLAWVQVYYNPKGELSFKRIPAIEIIPFWQDADHTILEAIIRTYTVIKYLEDGSKKEVVKIEYHTEQGVWYYVKGAKGLEPDTDKASALRGHFYVAEPVTNIDGTPQTDKQGNIIMQDVEATWDKVPFVAFKYNANELSLLKYIKPLIDDYDINTSDTSNNLQDVPNSVKVVKNYDGTDKGEFVHNLATYRTAFVSGDGDMSSIETNLDITAVEAHLNRLRKDIYESACAVDTQEANLGNASGVALKFRYADLDEDTTDMSSEFATALEELIWFIQIDMVNMGLGDYMDVPYDIIFNTDTIMNEAEVITEAKDSVGIISDETILANHPWVTDIEAEMQRVKKEREESLLEAQQQLEMDANGFGTDTSNSDNNGDE